MEKLVRVIKLQPGEAVVILAEDKLRKRWSRPMSA